MDEHVANHPESVRPATGEDESLLVDLARQEVDQFHQVNAAAAAQGAAPAAAERKPILLPQAGPAPETADDGAAEAPGAVAFVLPDEKPAPPEGEPPALGQAADGEYRPDRSRRGANFVWPKEVLELVYRPDAGRQPDLPAPAGQAGPAAATQDSPGRYVATDDAAALTAPPEQFSLAAPPLSDQQIAALHPMILVDSLQALRRPRPLSPRAVKAPPRHDKDLLLQLAAVAAGAWLSVVMAWLML